MRKEEVRAVFDGSIFSKKAEEHKQKKAVAKRGKSGKRS